MSVREVSWDTKPLGLPDSAEMPRYQWTRDQYHDLMTSGILKSGAPYELLAGEIVRKVTANQPHVIACQHTNRRLAQIFGIDFVQILAPIGIGTHSEPEPDIYVLRTEVEGFTGDAPTPADVRLVVEVSDATVRKDLGAKALLYARAGIEDFWALLVKKRTLLDHSGPTPDVATNIVEVAEHESVAPLTAPDARTLVSEMLPPA